MLPVFQDTATSVHYTLKHVREEKQPSTWGIVRTFSEIQQLEQPQCPPAVEKEAVSTPRMKVSETSGEGKGCKLVTSGMKRMLGLVLA